MSKKDRFFETVDKIIDFIQAVWEFILFIFVSFFYGAFVAGVIVFAISIYQGTLSSLEGMTFVHTWIIVSLIILVILFILKKRDDWHGEIFLKWIKSTEAEEEKPRAKTRQEKENRIYRHMNWNEKRLYKQLAARGLFPEHEYKISQMTVDFAFPDVKLVVEVDGHYHDDLEQKEKDKRRDYVLGQLKWKVIRINTRRKDYRPESSARYIKGKYNKLKYTSRGSKPRPPRRTNRHRQTSNTRRGTRGGRRRGRRRYRRS